jgi:hypothetical protein
MKKPSVRLDAALLLSQECSLCQQTILPDRRVPLNVILIEGFGLCPNCCQRVSRKTEAAPWYRNKWLRRVKAISRDEGWGWEYHLGEFRSSLR